MTDEPVNGSDATDRAEMVARAQATLDELKRVLKPQNYAPPTERDHQMALEQSYRELRKDHERPVKQLLPHPDDQRHAGVEWVSRRGEVIDAPPIKQPPGIALVDKIANALSPPAPRFGDPLPGGDDGERS